MNFNKQENVDHQSGTRHNPLMEDKNKKSIKNDHKNHPPPSCNADLFFDLRISFKHSIRTGFNPGRVPAAVDESIARRQAQHLSPARPSTAPGITGGSHLD